MNMKNLLIAMIVSLTSCQNMAIERNPNSLSHKFVASRSCAEIDTNLEQLNQHPKYVYQDEELSKWINPKSQIKAISLVAHGLNLRPSKMDALSKELSKSGIKVLRVSLAGHRGSKKEGLYTTHDAWRNEFQAHYCLAYKEAKSQGVPLYFLGFSLGALVGLDFLNTQEHHDISRMLLIAPASDVHWYSEIPGKLGWIGGRISLPSKNLKEYRSQPSTSLASYRSMKKAQASLKKMNVKSLNIPTLIYVDPDDELVSLKKINKRIKENKLDQWNTKELSNSGSTLKKTYHHLVVDKASMGPHQWELLKRELKRHFK